MLESISVLCQHDVKRNLYYTHNSVVTKCSTSILSLILFPACSRNPCKYPAMCTDGTTIDDYTCDCTYGYSGVNCDTIAGKHKNKQCIIP